MFVYFTFWSSVINLDLFWKQVFTWSNHDSHCIGIQQPDYGARLGDPNGYT